MECHARGSCGQVRKVAASLRFPLAVTGPLPMAGGARRDDGVPIDFERCGASNKGLILDDMRGKSQRPQTDRAEDFGEMTMPQDVVRYLVLMT